MEHYTSAVVSHCSLYLQKILTHNFLFSIVSGMGKRWGRCTAHSSGGWHSHLHLCDSCDVGTAAPSTRYFCVRGRSSFRLLPGTMKASAVKCFQICLVVFMWRSVMSQIGAGNSCLITQPYPQVSRITNHFRVSLIIYSVGI